MIQQQVMWQTSCNTVHAVNPFMRLLLPNAIPRYHKWLIPVSVGIKQSPGWQPIAFNQLTTAVQQVLINNNDGSE